MEAKELRIGNWVNYEQESGEIIEMRVNQIQLKHARNSSQFYLINERFLADFDPIALTEKWLVRFGFEKIDTGHMMAWSVDKFHLLQNIATEPFECYMTFNNDSATINHVHQLQNLYFALTNTELEING